VAARVSDRDGEKSKRKQERHARDRQTLRDLAVRLKALRKQRGLSQDRLAELAGLTGKYVGEVERGEVNPSATTIARLAEALTVDAGELFETADDILPVPAIQMDRLQEAFWELGRAVAGLSSSADREAVSDGAHAPHAPRAPHAPPHAHGAGPARAARPRSRGVRR
jgi:transcriptional regulator with XRE-family HTH domain